VRPSRERLDERHARRGQAPYVLLGIFAAVLAVGFGGPTPAFGNPSPSIAAKQAEAHQVVAQIDELNASLGRSDELLNLANLKLTNVQRDVAQNRHELRIAKHNLAASQREIARRLVTLYTNGTTSTLEVILGAKSLVEVLTRIDTENRVSSLDAQVANQVVIYKSAVKHHARALAVEKRQVIRLVAERQQQQRAIETRLGERRRLLSSLNGEVQRLIAAQQRRELLAAQAAQARYAAAQEQPATPYATTAVGATAQTPEGATVIPPSSHGGVVGVALQYLGVPYVWAGSSPGGFDCSGLVMYSYSQIGISLPHSSYAMWGDGVPVPRDQLQPGDLVFFDGLGHVGLYIGGGQFVHAPHTGTVVQVSSLDAGSYAYSYVGARRIL
jgi:cell wall-associated NlpC family hydrolase